MIGLGLGSRAIRAFIDSVVFIDPAITACVSDPETRNGRSLRAFEKAGFAGVRTVQLPGESVTRQIMRCDRPR
jgi:RimJ/RimL family protein N-acetyltransferase